MSLVDFAATLEAARAGDERSLRWLWDRYAGEVKGALLARGTSDVDEVVNDVFVAAFGGLDRFTGDEAGFRAWVHRIARNKRVDALRRSHRQPIPGYEGGLRVGDSEEEAIDALTDDEVRLLLAPLTPDQRDVIVLRFIADLSLEQVSVALDRPIGAVKALQHRALEQLRKRTGPDPYPRVGQPAMS